MTKHPVCAKATEDRKTWHPVYVQVQEEESFDVASSACAIARKAPMT